MVKRIKKRTKAQTPAPKKDRVKGSSKNPSGSASGSRGGIEIGAQATKALENMRDKHNAAYKRKGRRVDLGQLKAVFRRGAGAFSVSHRPGMTRNQWALARVRAFLKLVGTGQRKKAYNTDLDLLPKDHPQYKPKAEAKSEQLQPKKYEHIDFTPPEGVRAAAARALEVRASKPPSQRGMTEVGIARARDLKAGRKLSPDTVRRMLSYFSRHEVDKKGASWKEKGKGWQAWHGWGGDAGKSWARKVVRQMNAADEKTSLRAYSELSYKYEVPEGLTMGKPFKTLALGQVSSRMSGDDIGKEVTREMLSEMLRVFNERRLEDPVVIDWQHATSPYGSGPPAPPESGNALGQIVDLELREDGLYAYPAYNERGLNVVNEAGGVLWSSPEFLSGDVYDRAGGSYVGSAQLLAITLTPRPAQSNNRIDRVTLSEAMTMDEMSMEQLKAALASKDAMVKELEATIKDMKQDAESKITSKAEEEEEEKEKMRDGDEEERMAETQEDRDDKKEKMEEKREKEYRRMTEASVSMLSEINALKEQVQKLHQEKLAVKRDQAVKELISSGRITPAEQTAAAKAYELHEDGDDTFWAMFSERTPSGAIPLGQVGHGASGVEINRATLDAEIKKLQQAQSITYSEALEQFRNSNRTYYNQAFGFGA